VSLDAGPVVASVLRLEAERVVALAQQLAGTPRYDRLMELDRQLGILSDGLERRGVNYPGHVIGARYGLSGGEYLMLLVALMPHHAPDLRDDLREAIGGPDDHPRRSYVLLLLDSDSANWAALDAEFEQSALILAGLVVSTPLPDGDERLTVSLAILELFGLVSA
jgi:hypothetical protein